jgi:hypothetical protein
LATFFLDRKLPRTQRIVHLHDVSIVQTGTFYKAFRDAMNSMFCVNMHAQNGLMVYQALQGGPQY